MSFSNAANSPACIVREARSPVKRLVLSVLFAAATAVMPAAATGKPVAVVELFTSQGCSSCPEADAFLGELARRDGVIALAWHVDYWDYMGWKDTLGDPGNTERQEAYRRALGNMSKYTPQMIVNGRHDIVGSHRGEVEARIAQSTDALPVPVSLSRVDGTILIRVGEGTARSKANVLLVCFGPPRTVSVRKGENSGRDITYWNAVTGWQTAGMWHGEEMQVELPMSSLSIEAGGGCAALVQEMAGGVGPGPILGAASISFGSTAALRAGK